ncbi:MAG: MBL fold metallo-hydrolase [Pseudomonadota bacterium]
MAITFPNRRTLLKGIAASNLALLGWPLTSAGDTTLSVQQLNDRLSLITGAGGNVVLYKGNDGLTLIDSGSPESTAELLALVAELGNKAPLKTLINTHWHEDHSGGNEAIHALGAQIIAHENTKLWLGADFDVEWRQTSHKPRPAEALPDLTTYTQDTLDLGGETVEYGNYAQAHTDGDLYVWFPTSNVLVAGGLMTNKKYPITDIATGGWIGGLLAANKAMLELVNDNTMIIPDRGPAMTKADLQVQHDMLNDLYEKMKELARNGISGQDMLKEKVTADYDAIWGDPEEFVLETYRGMWAHTYDMGGFI